MSVKLITATDETLTFSVSSHSRPENHYVDLDIDNGYMCTCEHHYYRKVECKHIREVKEYLQTPHNYTIVGISYYKVLELTPEITNHLINMGTYNEIKEWRQSKCLNSQQEMKLKI